MYNRIQLAKSKRVSRGGFPGKNREFNLIMLAIIPLLQVFVFSYVAMFGLVIAFKDYRFDKGILGSKWVGFDNFKFLLTSSDFARVAWHTIYLNAIFIVVGMICAIIVATAVVRTGKNKALMQVWINIASVLREIFSLNMTGTD